MAGGPSPAIRSTDPLMKIKLLVPLNGPGGGGIEGDVIEWEDEDAYRFINAGYAEFVPSVDEAAVEAEPVAESAPVKRTRKAKA